MFDPKKKQKKICIVYDDKEQFLGEDIQNIKEKEIQEINEFEKQINEIKVDYDAVKKKLEFFKEKMGIADEKLNELESVLKNQRDIKSFSREYISYKSILNDSKEKLNIFSSNGIMNNNGKIWVLKGIRIKYKREMQKWLNVYKEMIERNESLIKEIERKMSSSFGNNEQGEKQKKEESEGDSKEQNREKSEEGGENQSEKQKKEGSEKQKKEGSENQSEKQIEEGSEEQVGEGSEEQIEEGSETQSEEQSEESKEQSNQQSEEKQDYIHDNNKIRKTREIVESREFFSLDNLDVLNEVLERKRVFEKTIPKVDEEILYRKEWKPFLENLFDKLRENIDEKIYLYSLFKSNEIRNIEYPNETFLIKENMNKQSKKKILIEIYEKKIETKYNVKGYFYGFGDFEKRIEIKKTMDKISKKILEKKRNSNFTRIFINVDLLLKEYYNIFGIKIKGHKFIFGGECIYKKKHTTEKFGDYNQCLTQKHSTFIFRCLPSIKRFDEYKKFYIIDFLLNSENKDNVFSDFGSSESIVKYIFGIMYFWLFKVDFYSIKDSIYGKNFFLNDEVFSISSMKLFDKSGCWIFFTYEESGETKLFENEIDLFKKFHFEIKQKFSGDKYILDYLLYDKWKNIKNDIYQKKKSKLSKKLFLLFSKELSRIGQIIDNDNKYEQRLQRKNTVEQFMSFLEKCLKCDKWRNHSRLENERVFLLKNKFSDEKENILKLNIIKTREKHTLFDGHKYFFQPTEYAYYDNIKKKVLLSIKKEDLEKQINEIIIKNLISDIDNKQIILGCFFFEEKFFVMENLAEKTYLLSDPSIIERLKKIDINEKTELISFLFQKR